MAGSFHNPDDRRAANLAAGFVGWGADSDVPLGDGSGGWKTNMAANMASDYSAGENFFSVFSIFFPAVTGIMAGANISGLLRDPSVNIPKGTFYAIFHSTVVYCLMAFVCGAVVSRVGLKEDALIMAKVELAQGVLVLIGVYARSKPKTSAELKPPLDFCSVSSRAREGRNARSWLFDHQHALAGNADSGVLTLCRVDSYTLPPM